jgi:uncharacterized protein (PEP-CTERM system associated)
VLLLALAVAGAGAAGAEAPGAGGGGSGGAGFDAPGSGTVLLGADRLQRQAYAICPYDDLGVAVFGQPELSRRVVVRPDGYIALPLIGEVRAAGRTPDELGAALRERLNRVLVEPLVDVDVRTGHSDCRGVRIIGAVRQPQAVPYATGMRVPDVLVAAGGLAPTADGNAAVLIRGAPDRPSSMPLRLGDLARGSTRQADLAVAPGDVIIVPQGFFAGDWRRDLTLTLAPAYTDNYNLAPSGDEDPAFISSVTPAIEIAGSGARFTGALSAALTGQYVALTRDTFEVIPNVVGIGNAELVRDTLYLDGATAIAMVALDAETPTSALAINTRDQALVQSYLLSPYAVTRLKDVALAELRYTLAGIVVDDDNNTSRRDADNRITLSDSITNGLGVQLASPPERRSRFGWQARASGQQTARFGDSDVLAAGATVSPRYALSRSLSLLTVAGYSVLRVGDEELTGPEAAAGFLYEPSPKLSLRALGGWRLENPQADVVLRSELGPRTTLTATYRDSVAVGQTTLTDTLGDVDYDPLTRQFVSQRTGLTYLPTAEGFTLEDDLTRIRQAALSLSRHSGNSRYSLSGFVTDQEAVNGGDRRRGSRSGSTEQFIWGAVAAWEQALNPATVFTTSVGYANSSDDDDDEGEQGATGSFEEVRLQLGLTHALTDRVSTFVRYSFQRRFADTRDDRFTENAVLVGLTHKF